MRSSLKTALLAGLVVGVSTARPARAAAREPASSTCASRTEERDPFLAEVARARDLESPDAAKAALETLEPEARRLADESPTDAEAQYRLAAVLGAQLDFEHGRMKMSGAEQVRDQAQRVLALNPNHGGASYMLGRLHASVLRLSGFKRFMAKALFGGDALEGASWERAQQLLEVAVREDPCVPEHHFELARVYAQRGDDEAAQRELASVRELTEGREGRDAQLRARVGDIERQFDLAT